MDILSGLILGAVQGIMEFLPISSSGHLVLIREVINIDNVNILAMNAVLYISTSMAMIFYFWGDIWILIQTLMRKMGRLPVNEKDLILLQAIAIGTIPAVILGLIFESVFKVYLSDALVVAVVLLVSALFLMYAEWRYYLHPPQAVITVRRGWQIGLFQVLALVPGFSRLGATMGGGMLLGLTRFESARFSFLLAIPVTLGLGTKKLLDLIITGGEVAWLPIFIGASISFVLALLAIHFFLAFIRRYTLWPFIWYTLIVSLLAMYYLIFVK